MQLSVASSPPGLKRRALGLSLLLAAANLAVWVLALAVLHGLPLFLSTAFLAYCFGLRHALDADHIAAIDNVTRKLMQDGRRPTTVGLFFSLGHSTVVFVGSTTMLLTAGALDQRWAWLRSWGGTVGTLISAAFLFIIAVLNLLTLIDLYGLLQRVRGGDSCCEQELDRLLTRRGGISQLLSPLFGLIRRSWQVYPLGFLFGLGFDTVTEVALLGIAATEASRGWPLWSVMLLPLLFAAGMSLVDTADGILMLGAYGWAFVTPARKLSYNVMITGLSVVTAALVGGVETLGLIVSREHFAGRFWIGIGRLNQHFGLLGCGIVALFLLSWGGSALLCRDTGSVAATQRRRARP